MNATQLLRFAELKVRTDRKLCDIPSTVRDMILPEIANTLSGRAYILVNGPLPSDSELIAEIWVTPRGLDIRAILAQQLDRDQEEEVTNRSKVLDEMAKLPKAQRISAARAAGLVNG